MTNHRQTANTGIGAIYQHMRAIGIEHFKILLLEQTGPTTKEALRAIEHIYVEIGWVVWISYEKFDFLGRCSNAIVISVSG